MLLARRLQCLGLVVWLLGAVTASFGASPSFNCDHARTRIELMICASDQLSTLDKKMAAEYFRLRGTLSNDARDSLTKQQRAFLSRRGECATKDDPSACVAALYRSRINELAARPSAAPPAAREPESASTTEQQNGSRFYLVCNITSHLGSTSRTWPQHPLPVDPVAKTVDGHPATFTETEIDYSPLPNTEFAINRLTGQLVGSTVCDSCRVPVLAGFEGTCRRVDDRQF
jgi:uncharacterized protein